MEVPFRGFRTLTAEHEVQVVEVLGAEHVAVAPVAVRVAVHDGRGGGCEHEHVQSRGHVALAHEAPLDQAQREAHGRVAEAVQRQLHAPRLLLQQRRQAACAVSLL